MSDIPQELNREALEAAFRVNHHPSAEPSSVELAALSRSITAYLSALPAKAEPGALSVSTGQEPVAWQHRSRFVREGVPGADWLDWSSWQDGKASSQLLAKAAAGYFQVEERPLYASPAPQAVPAQSEGWRLVPVEPTEAMIEAHFRAHAEAKTVFADVPVIWKAMINAAPLPTPPTGKEGA